MKSLTYLLCSAAIGILAACGTLSVSQTIESGYLVARDYNARTDRYIDAGVIDKAEAQKRVDNVGKAKTGLDTARVALAECRRAKIPDNECWKAAASATAARALLSEVDVHLVKEAQ